MNKKIINLFSDILIAIFAGIVVGTAYFFFQNSNGFAPGGVGGLATITHYLCSDKVNWSVLMIAFNVPIFILVSIFVDKKLGFILIIYMLVQSFIPDLYEIIGFKSYSKVNNQEDFNIVFACIATGVISGCGYSIMLKRFSASGGTYGISALIKKIKPETNIAYISFILDASVVFVAFFVYGMRITPVICTLINLFIANVVVDKVLSGLKNGYKFEIITSNPEKLTFDLLTKMKHGVTSIDVTGTYTDSHKYMLVCIINKKQLGQMMKILKNYPDSFVSFHKVNEILGNFKRIA